MREKIVGRFKADDGNATVEFVVIFPIFVILLALLVDTSLLFHGQARVLQTVQNANRSFSVGKYTETDEVEAYVEQALSNLSDRATIVTAVEDDEVTTQVSIPTRDLAAVGLIGSLVRGNVFVQATHLVEY